MKLKLLFLITITLMFATGCCDNSFDARKKNTIRVCKQYLLENKERSGEAGYEVWKEIASYLEKPKETMREGYIFLSAYIHGPSVYGNEEYDPGIAIKIYCLRINKFPRGVRVTNAKNDASMDVLLDEDLFCSMKKFYENEAYIEMPFYLERKFHEYAKNNFAKDGYVQMIFEDGEMSEKQPIDVVDIYEGPPWKCED